MKKMEIKMIGDDVLPSPVLLPAASVALALESVRSICTDTRSSTQIVAVAGSGRWAAATARVALMSLYATRRKDKWGQVGALRQLWLVTDSRTRRSIRVDGYHPKAANQRSGRCASLRANRTRL
jgi:hypothetical protein